MRLFYMSRAITPPHRGDPKIQARKMQEHKDNADELTSKINNMEYELKTVEQKLSSIWDQMSEVKTRVTKNSRTRSPDRAGIRQIEDLESEYNSLIKKRYELKDKIYNAKNNRGTETTIWNNILSKIGFLSNGGKSNKNKRSRKQNKKRSRKHH
jgi:predicted RNase H-like nuclease (RuvC/YqgF family)